MNHCDEILLDRLVNGSLDLQKNISCRIHLPIGIEARP